MFEKLPDSFHPIYCPPGGKGRTPNQEKCRGWAPVGWHFWSYCYFLMECPTFDLPVPPRNRKGRRNKFTPAYVELVQEVIFRGRCFGHHVQTNGREVLPFCSKDDLQGPHPAALPYGKHSYSSQDIEAMRRMLISTKPKRGRSGSFCSNGWDPA